MPTDFPVSAPLPPLLPDPDKKKSMRNIVLLSFSQALNGSSQGIVMSVGALAGVILAPDPVFATLPTTVMITGLALTAIPATMIIDRLGPKHGFMVGTVLAFLGGLSASYAMAISSFVYFCIALAFVGAGAAFAQQYRFAAADSVADEFKARAISLVLLGGVLAGFLGPRLSFIAKDWIGGQEFAGSFLMIAVLAVAAFAFLSFTRLAPIAKSDEYDQSGRSLGELIRTPAVFVPVISGMATYSLMTFVMVAAPLAMVTACGHSVETATTAIQWHIVAMFAPSFVTGYIINKIGAHLTTGIGMFLILLCAAISLNGITEWHFYSAMVLLGVGWNFGFIGSTTLLSKAYGPSEAAKTKGLNEQLVFGSMALASIGSGALLQLIGWQSVNVLVIPIATGTIALLAWGEARHRREQKLAI
ncbi:MAG: MFS transporter [Devosiaceae bacterium]|nr:MFS transporter [Devosiaceae bacterium]